MFPATNGRATGIGGLVLAAAIAVYGLVAVDARIGVPMLAVAFLLAVLTYAAVLRPRIGVSDQDLVLRQMFSTTRIPLAAIEDVTVRHIAKIRVAGRTYDSPALSRRRASLRRRARGMEPVVGPTDLVTERIEEARASARRRAGVAEYSPEQALLSAKISTEWSWPLVALATLGLLGLVGALL